MNHPNEQIPQVRNSEDQTKEAAAKMQQHHRKISWPKPERHPKAMSTAATPRQEKEENANVRRRSTLTMPACAHRRGGVRGVHSLQCVKQML